MSQKKESEINMEELKRLVGVLNGCGLIKKEVEVGRIRRLRLQLNLARARSGRGRERCSHSGLSSRLFTRKRGGDTTSEADQPRGGRYRAFASKVWRLLYASRFYARGHHWDLSSQYGSDS